MPDALPPIADPDWLEDLDLGWRPIVARDLRPVGVRIEVRSERPLAPAPAADLIHSVITAFSGDDGATFPRGLVLLAPQGIDFDASYIRLAVPRNALLEVPASDLADAAVVEALGQVQRQGLRLVLRLDCELPQAARRLSFQYVVRSLEAPIDPPPGSGVLAMGARSRAEALAAFDAGAHAIVGWPVHEAAVDANGSLQPAQKTVLELIRLLQAEADATAIERAFRAEPMLLYLLLTLANSPAFRRGANIASVTHAITLLGYKRLLKWLVLLLVIASKGNRALPHIHTAVVRGFFMENLADAVGARELRDDAFVTGAFSLLDRIIGLDSGALFSDVALPDTVINAVIRDEGPVAPLLMAARAIESAERSTAGLAVSVRSRNVAMIQALVSADALQSLV